MFTITLRSARELRGFSIKEVAVYCAITEEDVKKYESDTRCIPFTVAKKMKRLFHIKLEQVFIGLESDYDKNFPPRTCLKRA
ncbi:hypothetical protein DEAC_c02310 [Desulfosporosinus acididurans]|uniref:HTH cro/C1-type domain-containing protein n=1 Tax=Desulfosporosinus acididurans TaxID=476652 RepID=A0A0J1FWP7_9FIRM|nr:helix-turn-helix transcriptional regulator [Desulfosporosinus acididurans]KLU67824.1 hypothetical protein DEAC_c02310 [Desulfosporosinus acididurans]